MATWPYFSSFSCFVQELSTDTGITFSMFSDVFTMFTDGKLGVLLINGVSGVFSV